MDAGCFAAGYPDITLSISDNYADMNGDGQKHGSFWIHAMLCSDALENLVTDATVKRFAEFTSGLMRIRYRAIPEINAIALGHDAILREQLKKTDISPFCNLSQWYSQSYLKGQSWGMIHLALVFIFVPMVLKPSFGKRMKIYRKCPMQ